jgi:hypothetical protein
MPWWAGKMGLIIPESIMPPPMYPNKPTKSNHTGHALGGKPQCTPHQFHGRDAAAGLADENSIAVLGGQPSAEPS